MVINVYWSLIDLAQIIDLIFQVSDLSFVLLHDLIALLLFPSQLVDYVMCLTQLAVDTASGRLLTGSRPISLERVDVALKGLHSESLPVQLPHQLVVLPLHVRRLEL